VSTPHAGIVGAPKQVHAASQLPGGNSGPHGLGGAAPTDQIGDFIARVLPWPQHGEPGYINLHWFSPNGPGMRGRAHTKLEDFLSMVQRSVTNPGVMKDIYFCLSSQSEHGKPYDGHLSAIRNQCNVIALKSIWLDIDVKPDKGYSTVEAADIALATFCADASLPPPSAIVHSGGGMHVYWISDRPLTKLEWQSYAEGLKALTKEHGLKCDAAVTTDSARVLRVPGTFNYKTDPPKPVRLAALAPQDLSFAKQLTHIQLAVTEPAVTIVPSLDPVKFPPRPIPPEGIESLAEGIFTDEHTPLDWTGVIKHCPHFRDAAKNNGAGYEQGLWMMDVLACTFLEDGRKLAHYLSKGYKTYDPAETDEMYDRKEADRKARGLGWPSCKAFEDAGCQLCAKCPHKDKIRSPLKLAHLGPPLPNYQSAEISSKPDTWNSTPFKISFANIPHRRWLYATNLIRGELTVLAAPGGAGKTALAMAYAVAVATGRELLGETVWVKDEQRALYLNGEDSNTEIMRRLGALGREHGITEPDLGRLYVAGADDPRIQCISFLHVNNQGASVLNEAGFNVLERALQDLRPDLIILDPLVVFCGGGNMNDNAVMSLVMRKLKALAVRFDCAIVVVHHTRKGRTIDDATGDAERISGAAAIVNLARRALMPATMSETEAKTYGVLPSQRGQFFKLLDVKSNLAPISADAPWFELVNVELPNPEPPTYPNGDRVQAVKRAELTQLKAATSIGPEQQAIRYELMKLVDRGLTIDDEKVPYSPNSTGNNKKRAILDDAVAAIERITPDREWLPRDLRATAERALETLKHDGWVVVEKIEKGRFRRSHGLRAVWERTPWAEERRNLQEHGGPTVRTEQEQQELDRSDSNQCLDDLLIPDGQLVNDTVND
jgi:hypothetical protein